MLVSKDRDLRKGNSCFYGQIIQFNTNTYNGKIVLPSKEECALDVPCHDAGLKVLVPEPLVVSVLWQAIHV